MIKDSDNFIMLSYEKPRHESRLKVTNMKDFAQELGKRIVLKKLELAETLGKYGGETENSVMLKLPANVKMLDILTERYEAMRLAKDLGQESILLRVNGENFLINAQDERVMMRGVGIKMLDSNATDDYTVLNGEKFTLGLD